MYKLMQKLRRCHYGYKHAKNKSEDGDTRYNLTRSEKCEQQKIKTKTTKKSDKRPRKQREKKKRDINNKTIKINRAQQPQMEAKNEAEKILNAFKK